MLFMTIRVIAGCAGGFKLDVAKQSSTRPYLEKARGALFNALAYKTQNAIILDVYAGSGILGIEAMSRGGSDVTFIEADKSAAQVIEKNLTKCKIKGRVICARAEIAVKSLDKMFDLIFVDPPFPDAEKLEPTGRMVMETLAKKLMPNGLIIFRKESNKPAESFSGLQIERDREYGRSRVIWYTANNQCQTSEIIGGKT